MHFCKRFTQVFNLNPENNGSALVLLVPESNYYKGKHIAPHMRFTSTKMSFPPVLCDFRIYK